MSANGGSRGQELFWEEFFDRAMRDSAGEVEGDPAPDRIDDLNAAVRQLVAVERRYRVLLDQMPVATYIAEARAPMHPRYVCDRIESLLGYPRERWLEEPDFWIGRVHPEDRDRVLADERREAASTAPLRREYRMVAASGNELHVREERAPIELDGDGPGLVQGVLIEVGTSANGAAAEARSAEAGAGLAASPDPAAPPSSSDAGGAAPAPCRDGLTRLPDRALLREHLDLALARARDGDLETALLHIDLDEFRLVNDGLGLDAGDEVLRQVAGRLEDLTLATTLLARHGDDEFLLLLPDLKAGTAEGIAEIAAGQIAVALEEPFAVAGAEFQLGASIGVSLYPGDARDADALLRHADAAMYQAKESGGGGFALYAGATLDAIERLSIPIRLRRALERAELVLHYQPIFRLPSGEIESVEALIRWRDPERGLVPPLDFIPVAEYTGLIDPIGDWVVEAVCEQARAWRAEGLGPRINFNVSLRQFCGPRLVGTLERHLGAGDLDAAGFTMEITESTAMREPERVEPILREVHELGLTIAIDDFGVGYSSLGRLRQMPVHTLKIDRSFMVDAPGDPAAANILAATIELVQALGMEAVAEGVETEEQRRFLADQGCPLAQGFHLARPMPAEEMTALLRGSPVAPRDGRARSG